MQIDALNQILRKMGSVAIAYSGGVDSTFLLAAALRCGMQRVLALTVKAEFHTTQEVDEAIRIAEELGAELRVIPLQMNAIPHFEENPEDRCYHCKKALFGALIDEAGKDGIPHLAEASNTDDEKDYRPGMRALKELGVRSPLREAGMDKAEIRAMSRTWGLQTWNKPSAPCLATRFPYGERITEERLAIVEQAEEIVRQLGIDTVRVRLHGNVARIEVSPDNFPVLSANATTLSTELKKTGIKYVTLDLEGFRSGSMNEVIACKKSISNHS